MDKVAIRWMIRRDMKDVLKIEKKNNGELAWQEKDFLATLRQKNCVPLVSVMDDKVVGFCIYVMEKGYFEVTNLEVEKKYVSCGISEAFINKMKMKLANSRKDFVIINVLETNLDIQLFLRDSGFKAIKVIKEYFGTEDAYKFVYSKESNVKVNQ